VIIRKDPLITRHSSTDHQINSLSEHIYYNFANTFSSFQQLIIKWNTNDQ